MFCARTTCNFRSLIRPYRYLSSIYKTHLKLLLLIVLIGHLCACHSWPSPRRITTADCIKNPTLPAGIHNLTIRNTTDSSLEFSLTSYPDNKVYAQIDNFAPATSRSLYYAISPGTFRFNCYFDEEEEIRSSLFTVSGKKIRSPYPPVKPVSIADINPYTRTYEQWVLHQFPQLIAYAHALHTEIERTHYRAAEHLWFKIHYLWETLGAAYGAFGDLGIAINSSSAGLVHGISDPHFTGIHAIESILFTEPTSPATNHRLLALSTALIDNITTIYRNPVDFRIDPIDMGIRAHEILENTLQFTLTGRDDYGSHSTLDTIDANITGTMHVIDCLQPLLSQQENSLPPFRQELTAARRYIIMMKKRYGGVSLEKISQTDRVHINALISGLTEKLSLISAITDIRRH